MDYYFKGEKKGPILINLNLCEKVDRRKDSNTKFECLKSATSKIKVNSALTAWTSWFVPQNGKYDDIMIQFIHNGMVRTTKDVTLTGGLRLRAFRTEQITKKGKWEIRVLRKKKIIAAAHFTAI